MEWNLSVFQEPRGVMRILHFIFSICAFATVTGYTGSMNYNCSNQLPAESYSYPFSFVFNKSCICGPTTTTNNCTITVVSPPSSDVKFFVSVGVLTMLYTILIIVVYAKLDDMYKKDTKFPLIDFVLTVAFGVLWLSSSAAWANSLSELKVVTNQGLSKQPGCTGCAISSSNFSTLNISVLLGFLNFVLWAADLWFVYKETIWFSGNQPQASSGA